MSDEIANLKHALAVAETWVEHHQNHCDDLIKENAALADENSRLHVELDAYHNGEQLRVLRAENAALRADRDRLDKLEKLLIDTTNVSMISGDVTYERYLRLGVSRGETIRQFIDSVPLPEEQP